MQRSLIESVGSGRDAARLNVTTGEIRSWAEHGFLFVVLCLFWGLVLFSALQVLA